METVLIGAETGSFTLRFGVFELVYLNWMLELSLVEVLSVFCVDGGRERVRQMVSVNLQIKVGVKHYLNLLRESYPVLSNTFHSYFYLRTFRKRS